ncbi:sensor histidine kinase [uncultured Jatrophihabitans sp.]|uniref:sensor histidine kinase n=1 Tax=uncultured Jatrophihabitans sp. TaxID=1610747 RepID=UPI0035CBA10B
MAVSAIVILTSAGVGLFRRAPAVALALVWIAGGVQALSVSDLLGAQAGVLLVAYGTARYGRRLTIWLGGISVPVGAALIEYYVLSHSTVLPSAIDIAVPLLRHTGVGLTSAFLLGTSGLGIPWTLGLVVRINARYRRTAVERERAQTWAAEAELSEQLHSEQVRLARDVHDMVGHSLAVIIAQADAAQIGAGDRDGPVQAALENIAAVARTSLGEVRQVLQDTRERTSISTPSPDLNDLVDRSRAAGHDIRESTVGAPVELTPQAQDTLYRVLQEMLTNAIKHGQPGRRIGLVHTWSATSYSFRVVNSPRLAPDEPLTTDSDGMGVEGMRSRLKEMDGTLLLSPPDDGNTGLFTATACIPLIQFRASS